MNFTLKMLSLIVGLAFFSGNYGLASSSRNMCESYTIESDLKYKKLLATFSSYQLRNEFLLDEAVSTCPESIFEHSFAGNENGVLKFQVACNVINLYVREGSRADQVVFGKMEMTEDEVQSRFIYLLTGMAVVVKVQTLVEKGLTQTVYGNKSLYNFIHRNDEAHKQKHRSKEETAESHCHIEHLMKSDCDSEDVERLLTALETAGAIKTSEYSKALLAFEGR